MGCGSRVSSGLDWVFSNVEEAIILEDDTVPHPTFFPFCQELLDRYRDVPEVFAICGDSVFHEKPVDTNSYRFSRFFSPWGWASWKSRWNEYDFSMGFWPGLRESTQLAQIIPEDTWRERWSALMDATASGKIDTWDYQWISRIWAKNGIVVHPTQNLITNIGTGSNSTHTFAIGNPRTHRRYFPAPSNLQHPTTLQPQEVFEVKVRRAFMGHTSTLSKLVAAARNMKYKFFTK
jgi:hypothetical protein